MLESLGPVWNLCFIEQCRVVLICLDSWVSASELRPSVAMRRINCFHCHQKSYKTTRRVYNGKGYSGVLCKRIRIKKSGKILLEEFQESWSLESGIQFKESEIPLTIGIQNPSFTDKYWDTVHGIRNPRRGIQNSRLSWIPFHEAMSVFSIRAEDSLCLLNWIKVY